MGTKKLTLIAAAAASALLVGRMASADTITLHDDSESTVTGIFTYDITLDAAADVQPGDGFVLYDFPQLTAWSITGSPALTSSGVGFNTDAGSAFTLVPTLTGDVLTQAASVNALAANAANANNVGFDSSIVPNLNFVYNAAEFKGVATATLTLVTSLLNGPIGTSVYGSVDHSGPNVNTPFGFSDNPILVPSSAPVPSALLGGLALFGLVGVGRLVKARRVMA